MKPKRGSQHQRRTSPENSALHPRTAGEPLSPQKKYLFTILTLLFPVLLYAVLELTLRLAHYGPDLSVFQSRTVDGRLWYSMNPEVKTRYFPQSSTGAPSSPDLFQHPKPHGTYRIFCLGGSTTVGFPYWRNASFPTLLRERLRAVFPRRTIEVINLGMTATNSFTVLDLARELPSFEPDLLIVYDGHNEFYGALGVASRETPLGSRWLTLLYLKLIHSRVFLLVRDSYERIRGLIDHSADHPFRGITMESLAKGKTIPYGSRQYGEALSVFEANLHDLRNLCRDHHIPLLLSTQVSNLRGRPPFESRRSDLLQSADRTAIDSLLSAGEEFLKGHDWERALEKFRKVTQLDSLHAGTHFAVACCLDVLQRRGDARQEYVRARDYDQLRFRTSSDFNEAILRMDDGAATGVVDMERAFMAHSPDSLIGNELILEHLHPTAYGSFLMAKGFATVMRQRALLAPPVEWTQNDTLADVSIWDKAPITELDERIAARRTEILIAGWPFSRTESTPSPLAPGDTLGHIAQRFIDGRCGWMNAHQDAAAYYAGIGDRVRSERERRVLENQVPEHMRPLLPH